MVWNDAQFRTQQWESDLQLQSDQFRSQSMQQGLGSIQRMGEQYSQNRQMNADRQMQGQQFDQQMMLRTAETNARLQLMEQERQENAIKLQALTAVDMAKRSRMETEAMDLQNRQSKLNLQMQEKKLSYLDQDRGADMLKGFDQNTMAGLASTDWVIDIGPDGSVIPRKDKAAAQQVLENIRNSKIDPQVRQADLDLTAARTQAEQERAKAYADRNALDVESVGLRRDEVETRRRQQLIDMLEGVIENGGEQEAKDAKRMRDSLLREMVPGGITPAPKGGGDSAGSGDGGSSGGPADDERAKSLSAMKARFNVQGIDGKPHYGEQESTWIATALTDHREAVLKAYMSAVSESRKYANSEQAMDRLLTTLRDPYSEKGRALAKFLMQIGGGK